MQSECNHRSKYGSTHYLTDSDVTTELIIPVTEKLISYEFNTALSGQSNYIIKVNCLARFSPDL